MSKLAEYENGRFNKFFTIDEFRCKCGCGKADMKQSFIDKLTKARIIANIPFSVSSGFRCKAYQLKLFKAGQTLAETSEHSEGDAADIRTNNSWEHYKVREACGVVGFNRFGHKKGIKIFNHDSLKNYKCAGRFLHVDDGSIAPANVEWIY